MAHEDYKQLYTKLHAKGKWWPGTTICLYKESLISLVRESGAKTLLDYGCGRGLQYTENRLDKELGVMPHLYDVGVPKFSRRPRSKFDGVICCDVMEHIAERDVPEILEDVMQYARKFVFFVIHLHPSNKKLSDQRGVHLTVKPKVFWEKHISRLRPPGLKVVVEFDTRKKDPS